MPFCKICFIIWVKTTTPDLRKNTSNCVWKPHITLRDLLKTNWKWQNVILQNLLSIWMKTTTIKIIIVDSQDVLQSCFEWNKKDLLSKLERKQHMFFHKVCFDILLWEQLCNKRKRQKSKTWVLNFANYVEDFCHRLKLKTSLKEDASLFAWDQNVIKMGMTVKSIDYTIALVLVLVGFKVKNKTCFLSWFL